MKEFFKNYQRGLIFFVKFLTVLYSFLTLVWCLKGIVENDIIEIIAHGVAFLTFTPYLLVLFGIVKPFGVSPKLVDLATYEFGTDAIPKDLQISLARAEALDVILLAYISSQPTGTVSPTMIARNLIIELNLNSKEALYVIYKSAIMIGAGKRAPNSTAALKEKLDKIPNRADDKFSKDLTELRDKLAAEKEKRKNNPPPDEPIGGKYDFL